MEAAAVGAAEDEQVAAAELEVGERGGAAVGTGNAEGAVVAEADRDDRRVGGFLAVLVEAELGARGVEVGDDGVGFVAGAGP